MRFLFASMLICLAGFSNVFAETIEGRLVSIDRETRDVTLDGGEVMALAVTVPVEELAIGQLLRLEYDLGTVEVSNVLVLEEPPPPPLSDEPVFVEE